MKDKKPVMMSQKTLDKILLSARIKGMEIATNFMWDFLVNEIKKSFAPKKVEPHDLVSISALKEILEHWNKNTEKMSRRLQAKITVDELTITETR